MRLEGTFIKVCEVAGDAKSSSCSETMAFGVLVLVNFSTAVSTELSGAFKISSPASRRGVFEGVLRPQQTNRLHQNLGLGLAERI